jgi:anti-sigma B factor antagonist
VILGWPVAAPRRPPQARSKAVSTLQISVEAGEAGPVIVLCGEADLMSAAELSDALTAQVTGRAQHLTVDLSGLEFADSASVRALVLAGQTLRERGGTLVLAHPQPAVARLLSLLGVDQMITVQAETNAEAEPEGA